MRPYAEYHEQGRKSNACGHHNGTPPEHLKRFFQFDILHQFPVAVICQVEPDIDILLPLNSYPESNPGRCLDMRPKVLERIRRFACAGKNSCAKPPPNGKTELCLSCNAVSRFIAAASKPSDKLIAAQGRQIIDWNITAGRFPLYMEP